MKTNALLLHLIPDTDSHSRSGSPLSLRSALTLRIALCATVAFITHAAPAQTWQTVDDFQYVPGAYAVNFGLAVAPSGILYASGFAADGTNTNHGLVMASADGGNTWSAPLDDFVYPGSATRYDGGIIADSAGNLYVAGEYYFPNGNFHRIVRRSADGGASWLTVDDLGVGNYSPFPLAAGALTADASGNIYATAGYPNTWAVRKGAGGANFSTVDSFQPSTSVVNGVFAHPTAGVFAVGYGSIGRSGQAWMVRRSLDGGATWSTVDTYQASSGSAAEAYGADADVHGNIYVVGRAFAPNKKTSIGHWQVRKSSNGGASWTTVDDYQPFTSGNQVALGFAADSNGNLFVAGWANSGTENYWIVRQNPGGTGNWITVETFSYVLRAEPHAIAADSLGNIFVGGQGSPSSGAVHWVVRKN